MRRLLPVVIFALILFPGIARSAAELPVQLSDADFWKLITEFSEPDGNFHSDNFVSNERSFQEVLTDLAEGRQPGSAYIGVGPEQSFTYLLAVKPRIAFIVDIRRQNMIQHLMYKALFEISTDRAEFISRLLSRPRPQGVGKDSTVTELFDAFRSVPRDNTLQRETLDAVMNQLMVMHGFSLDRIDRQRLADVFGAFFGLGTTLTYDGVNVGRTGVMPTFEQLMEETDKQGKQRSFLAEESNFQYIQQLQKKNLIVPVVGDFAGPKALRSVGQYLVEHQALVTAFYTSNVEHYLFQSPDQWKKFYANVAALPMDSRSVFVRGLIRSANGEISDSPMLPPTSHYETGLFSIADLVARFNSGLVRNYFDVIAPAK